VVTGFYYPALDEKTFGIGGERGGDVYLDLMPGYYFSGGMNEKAVKKVRPGGSHIYMPKRRRMHAMCYIKGPGIKKGKVLTHCRIIDIVPTLCHMLGIDPPSSSRGKVISGIDKK